VFLRANRVFARPPKLAAGFIAAVTAFGSSLVYGGSVGLGPAVLGPFGPTAFAPISAMASSTPYNDAILADSPTTFHRLDESTGLTAADSSGHGFDASYAASGVTLGTPGAIPAESGHTGISADGTAIAVTRSDDTVLPLGHEARTLEIWEKSTGVNHDLLDYGAMLTNFTSTGLEFYSGSSTLCLCIWSDRVLFSAPYSLADGQWHQIDATYNGDKTVVGYVDGREVGRGDLSEQMATTAGSQGLTIGGGIGTPTTMFNGSLDDAAIYPSALSAERIKAHFDASGAPPIGGPLTDPQGRGGGNPACSSASPSGAQGIHGDPVNSATGDYFETQVDFNIPGRGCPLSFSRTYNSSAAGVNGPVGYGWQSSVGMWLAVNGSTATVTQENGSQVTFNQDGTDWSPSAPRFIATLTHNGDGTWTLVRQGRDTYVFNSTGQLSSTTDLNGYREIYSYNASSQLSSIRDNAARTLTITWSGMGPSDKITEVDDANISPTRKVQYQYNDGRGNLTDVIDVGGGHWQFSYDASHRIVTLKDPKCFATTGCPGIQNDYDASGRVDWQKDQLGRQTSFAYTGDPVTQPGGTTTVTDPSGNVTVDCYQWGLLTSTTRGYGTADAGTTRYFYDPMTLEATSVTDPNGHVTTMTYDASGNLLTQKDPLANTTVNTYNVFNELLTTTDPLLVTSTMVYDANGNLTSVSRPLVGSSSVQTTTYNHSNGTFPGDVTSEVDPDNNTWTYSYDGNGYRSSATDPLGNQSTRVYNAEGWMTSSVSPKGNVAGCGCSAAYTTSFGHDVFGNLTTTTDPLGHVTRRHYDQDHNLDYVQDGNQSAATCTLGNASPCTQYAYDLANEQTTVRRADGTSLITDYNTDGTIQDQKDGLGAAIQTYGYDHQGRVSTVTDALNNVTTYKLDAAGNVLSKQDPGGNCAATPKVNCTSYSHDQDNRLTAVGYSDGVTPNVSGIQYDADGQRKEMTDGTGTSTWAWDSLHRLTSYQNGAASQVQYQYNMRNLVTAIAYPGGNCGSTPTLCLNRGYDIAGRWTSVTDWNANQTTFGYDPNSNLTTETLPASTGVVDTSGFDAADNLTSISDVKAPATLFSASYGRDAASQLSSDSSAPPTSRAYRYTPLEQLCYAGSANSTACASPPTGSTGYQYDAGDNLAQMGSTIQSFNAAHELCWTTPSTSSAACASPPTAATTYTYDNRGNRVSAIRPGGNTVTYGFDQANRLGQLSQQVGSNTTQLGSYAYNGDGLRMSKTVSGTTTQYAWDLASELPSMIQAGANRYVYGPGGLPLEQVTSTATLWLHHDQIGSTRVVTSAAGALVGTASYDPYGNVIAATGTALPFGFAGQYRDAESGFIYLRARYYDPSTAQFLSRDPLVAATRQPYAYSGGSPVNRTDPSGLRGDTPIPMPPPDFSPLDNVGIAYNFFVSQGLLCFQAAAIVGNLMAESGVDPTSQQPGGPGRGIAQWSVNERWQGVIGFAAAQRADPYTLGIQLDFMWAELISTEGASLTALRQAQDITSATVSFRLLYERAGVFRDEVRIADAMQVLNQYGGC
jgi:RHS repeat-associated protein